MLSAHMKAASAVAAVAFLATTASAQSTGSSNPSASKSTSTVLLSLAINAIIAAVEVTIFLILRPRFKRIYRPKTYLGPEEERIEPLPDSLFGWIMPFIKTPTKRIIEGNGLDAYMFVNYIEMMIWILGPIFIFTWALLLPVYAAGTTAGKTGFQLLTFGQVGTGTIEQRRYVAPLLAQWIITFWILIVIRKFVLNFIKLRQDFLVSPHHSKNAQARTLLVTGIPNDCLGEQKLKDIYSHMPGGVERVWLNRDLDKLPDLYDERQQYLNKLEAVESKIIKTAYKKVKKGKVAEGGMEADDVVDRFLTQKERPTMKVGAKLKFFGGNKVDAVDHLRSEIERLNKEIEAQRSDESVFQPANAAFLLFRTQVGCHMAKNMVAHHEPYKMSRRYIEAHPNAVIWSNLSMNPYAQKIRSALFWALTIVFIIVWLPLIAFTAIVSNLSGLCTEVSWLAWICEIGPATGIIQGFLPTILLAVLNILLPIILRVFAKQSGIPTTTEVELSLMDRMKWFNLIDNFLLFTIISGVSGGINQIVPILENPQGLPTLISQYIPAANIFYISFIILQALSGAAGGLLQVAGLIVFKIKAMLLAGTPRKTWHIHNALGAPAWGTLFPAITLTTTITFGYAILAPLINGFSFVAFILFFFLYKYTALYVWDIKPATETSGLFFMKAVNASMAGLYLSQLILAVLFFTAQSVGANGTTSQSAIPEGVFMVILMVITAGFHIILVDSTGALTTALPLSMVQPNSGSSPKGYGGNKHDGVEMSAYPTRPSNDNEKQRLVANAQANGTSSHAGGLNEFNNNNQQGNQKALSAAGTAADGEDDTQTFRHPALKEPQRTLWFPHDRFGLSTHAVSRAREHGLDATDEGSGFDEKNKITTSVYCPPGEVML